MSFRYRIDPYRELENKIRDYRLNPRKGVKMDFQLTPEQEALKKEFDTFFEAEMKKAPEGWMWGLDGVYNDIGWAFIMYMTKRLAEKGWLVRPWPKEYGGCSASIMEQLIFSDSIGYYCAPGVDPLGIGMIGPTLLAVGSRAHGHLSCAKNAACELQISVIFYSHPPHISRILNPSHSSDSRRSGDR